MKSKVLLSVILLVSIARISIAQSTFAPTGSVWYHSMYYGVFHSYYSGDTVILGEPCRKVVREADTQPSWATMGLTVNNLPTLYVYNTTDTVFVYNPIFNRFTPLYVYNVSAGDTISLPILPPEAGNSFIPEYADSVFSFVVDSVKIVLYDTALLKTVYTRPIIKPMDSGYVFSYANNRDSIGIYAERIGSITAGLMPDCLACANILDDRAQPEGSLRCYTDPTLYLKLTTDTYCGLPPVSVADLKFQTVNIYPVPAQNLLWIETGKAVINYQVTDTNGQILLQGKTRQTNPIDISNLPNGVYLLGIEQFGKSIFSVLR